MLDGRRDYETRSKGLRSAISVARVHSRAWAQAAAERMLWFSRGRPVMRRQGVRGRQDELLLCKPSMQRSTRWAIQTDSGVGLWCYSLYGLAGLVYSARFREQDSSRLLWKTESQFNRCH